MVDLTALDKKIAEFEGRDSKLYIFLTLENMMFLYNYITKKIIQEKKDATKGRYTEKGLAEKTRRVSLNPKLFRNQNTVPAGYKGRLETKARLCLNDMEESMNEYHRFLLDLRTKGQGT